MKGKSINEIKIGDTASFQKTISESDIYLFAGITGDFNPAHVNSEESKKNIFGKRVAHGMLIASFICPVLGMQLPGTGTIHLGQELKFVKPTFIGDTIKAVLKVVEIIKEKNIIILETVCLNQNKEIVMEGKATVRPPL